MKIVVLVKDVPDTFVDRKISLETGLADREASENIIDEICERAIEVALKHKDSGEGVEVTVMSMGGARAESTLRKALAMGADSAVHISDEKLLGADANLTSEVLAAALSRTAFDLVVAGNQSTDGSGGVMAAMLAQRLRVPLASSLSSVEISDGKVVGCRINEDGQSQVSVELPAVISITEALPDGRFPNFKGIMAAKKKPLEVLALSGLDVSADPSNAPRSILTEISEKPPRKAGTKVVDEGDGGEQIAEFLVANRLV